MTGSQPGHQDEPSEDDASVDAATEASADATVDASTDAGDAAMVDAGVDAGECTGFARYAIPAGSYAWGHKCSGYQLYTTVQDPPTQTECRYVGTTIEGQCIKWGPFAKDLVIFFKQGPSQDCNIQIYPGVPGGDAHSCF